MAEKKFKQVCQCENCGNEAEMMITCSLEDSRDKSEKSAPQTRSEPTAEPQKIKGHAVCSHCGNEADIWVDTQIQ